jgi:hypothetical protein
VTERAKRGVALAIAVFTAVMIVDNIVTAVGVQRTLPCDQRLCTGPRDLEQWSRAFAHPRVFAQLANFYMLRSRTPHTTITIPPWMKNFEWYFTEIARMRVVHSADNLVVDDAAVLSLTRGAHVRRQWLRRGGSRKRWLFQDLYVSERPGATEYVWAETSSAYGPIFVMPADDYARVARKAATP